MVKFYFPFFIIIQHQKGNELKSNKNKIGPQQQLRFLNSLPFSLVEQAESEKNLGSLRVKKKKGSPIPISSAINQ